jgi:predicted cupin superfamily sugar epimerase
MTGDEIVALLGMQPHPEGGFFVENYRHQRDDGRGHSTAIYFLLRAGDVSHWHTVDADEVYHYYAGAPLRLSIWAEGTDAVQHIALGPDLAAGERPQFVVPGGVWQTSRSSGDWTLIGCTVAPAFIFEGFNLAAPGWTPPAGESPAP